MEVRLGEYAVATTTSRILSRLRLGEQAVNLILLVTVIEQLSILSPPSAKILHDSTQRRRNTFPH